MRAGLFLLAAHWIAAGPLRAAPPRLTVVLVVDQMRADYLRRFPDDSHGGFSRLKREGAYYPRSRHAHAPTSTSVGHATLLTGCFPSEHGIVGNDWWERESARKVRAAEDAGGGRSPERLECPTLGDELKASAPGARVVSISGKDRAAVMMGGRRADLVLWYDKARGRFVTSPYYAPAPTWVERWNDGLGISTRSRESIQPTPRLDSMTFELAGLAVDRMSLGKGPGPDLLLVSLTGTDLIGHLKGPDSPEMDAQLRALDAEIGDFLGRLDRTFGRGRYAAALTSDHGVSPVPESPAGRRMGARHFDREALERDLEGKLEERFGGAGWVSAMCLPNVYLNHAAAEKQGVPPSVLQEEAARVLAGHPAVSRVFRPSELAGGEPLGRLGRVFRRSYHPKRSGDLLVLMKRNAILSSGPAEAAHELPYDDDALVALILSGEGVRPGRHGGEILAADLAPTLGRLLEIPLAPRVDRRVLEEALAGGGRHLPVTRISSRRHGHFLLPAL
jgi:arylsulfatase A-like enzyme